MPKKGVRPTKGIVRSAIFNILGEHIKNAWVIDIFAGSGALGIEALSCGAKFCVFVEREPMILLKNIKELGLQKKAKIIKQDFRPGLKRIKSMKFDIAFIDPPYKKSYANEALRLLYFYNLLNENSIVVVEHTHLKPLLIPEVYEIIKEKKYGNTSVTFLQLKRSER